MELLAQPNVDAQAEFYDRVWSNRRWKALFALVYGRRAMSLTYAPGFYARAAQTAFGPGLMGLVEHSLKHIPVGDNYFAYHNITGYYPAHRESALPPYLTRAGMARLREPGESPKLHLVDGSLTEYLGASPPRSVDGIAMSNICEWMNDAQTAGLFEQALRVARPDGIVCFRDHMGVTRVPPEFATQVIELVARGDALIRADRSMVQRGFHILQVRNQPTARAQSVDAAQ
jgi:S-adenosylmethionine-diacylglycerol 3-amino-3-carboxypropyl transferase